MHFEDPHFSISHFDCMMKLSITVPNNTNVKESTALPDFLQRACTMYLAFIYIYMQPTQINPFNIPLSRNGILFILENGNLCPSSLFQQSRATIFLNQT